MILQDGSSAACRFRERMESAFSLHRVSSIVLDRCKLGNSKHPDSCMFTTALLKYARLPVFLYSSIYDSYHLKYIMCSEDVDDINAYGRSIYSEIFSALNQQPANGGFIESCTHHSRCWSDIVVKGDTPASAFEKWYRGGTKNALWDMNETYATPVCINARHKHSCKALRFRRRHIEI